MTDFQATQRPRPVSFFASPELPAAAFAGVRTRRILAFSFDFLLVSILAGLLFTGLFVVTLGLSALILPSLWPFVAFFYNGMTVSGSGMGTPGMRLFGLEMRQVDGAPVGFVIAGIHAALLYASWLLFMAPLLTSLVSPDKRCLHDILAGVIVVRRP